MTTHTEWAVRYTMTRADGTEVSEVWPYKNEEFARDSKDYGFGPGVILRREVTDWEEVK